jgi:hypothetical protein
VFCPERRDLLRKEKEREFIDDMVVIMRRPGPTPKQQAGLEDLYLKLGGGDE